MRLRKLFGLMVMGMLCMGQAGAVNAADAYPSKDVRFLCWSAAGSSLDVMARTLGVEMEKITGKTFVVENRPGGSGAVAMSIAKSQPANGHVILSTTSSFTFNLAQGNIPFTLNDFTLVRAVEAEPVSVAVLKNSRFKTLDDFLEALRKGEKLRVGGFASAGFVHFVYYKLQQAAKVKGVWVPFEGGNQAATALLGGHLDAAVMTPSSGLSSIQNGDIRLLAVSAPERSDFYPDVPTMKELGYDVDEQIWRGVMVKSGTPEEICDALGAVIDKATQSPGWKNTMKTRFQSPYAISMKDLNKKAAVEIDERRVFLKTMGVLK